MIVGGPRRCQKNDVRQSYGRLPHLIDTRGTLFEYRGGAGAREDSKTGSGSVDFPLETNNKFGSVQIVSCSLDRL